MLLLLLFVSFVFAENYPRDCSRQLTNKANGISLINPSNSKPIFTECRNGWTVIMNRKVNDNPDYPFGDNSKFMSDYINGFSHFESDFWLGLENIRNLIKEERFQLRIEAKNEEDNYSIEYDHFYIHSGPSYSLYLGAKLSGNMDDSLSQHIGFDFYAPSSYEDLEVCRNGQECANKYKGGWWLKEFYHACLTCLFEPAETNEYHWSKNDKLKFSEVKMLIRPKFLYKPTSCYELLKRDNGLLEDGIYRIYTDADDKGTDVYCEMSKGGWTRIFNRVDMENNFDKNLTEYENGFGIDLLRNHWIGLKIMHLLTSKQRTSLRIELLKDTERQFIEYKKFLVHSKADNFKLSISDDENDSWGTLEGGQFYTEHNGMPFTAKDSPVAQNQECKKDRGNSGWWFYQQELSNDDGCFVVCLTCNDGQWMLQMNNGIRIKKNFTNIKMMIKPLDD